MTCLVCLMSGVSCPDVSLLSHDVSLLSHDVSHDVSQGFLWGSVHLQREDVDHYNIQLKPDGQ